jgi:hypothetical protein
MDENAKHECPQLHLEGLMNSTAVSHSRERIIKIKICNDFDVMRMA